MEKMIERYELLCKDVKYQIGFIDDFFDAPAFGTG